MTIRLVLGASLVVALVASTSFAQDRASQNFLKAAIEGNLAEVQMGQLAQKNGNSDGVRSFGQMLENDHGAAHQMATSVANSLGVTPPTAPNSQQKATYDRIAKLSGANFDREFLKHTIDDHKKGISEYEKQAKKNDAAGLYATETLPTLRQHLETAQSLASSPTIGKR